MPIKNTQYPKLKHDNLVCREVDGNQLIVDTETEQVHELNITASYIWNLCDGNTSSEAIIKSFSEAFDISLDQARTDVNQTLSGFVQKDLLLVESDSSEQG